ncbi:MAG: tRNA (N6-isopentenyl adenosine(37)-C2)-methylthiotransferase MiaB [Holosporales bacterium]|jgi:tRNA-2-methylthio-N6-dimethylallyladenosine synthase|nr:tRNA (N6-isopentenyl adenosine(37)-C2)-methylthiotransferase MiaB [Holosporales bacterium]
MQETSFYIKAYGCQMNVYDSKNIIEIMECRGFVRTLDPKAADILVFYTCNIRENAARKVFSAIGMLKSSKTKVIAIGGCVAQAEKDEIFKKSSLIDIVFGPHVYHKLPDYIGQILNGEQSKILDIGLEKFNKFEKAQRKNDVLFSEFVTIQEGCDNFCSYCVVPYTRGREYSRAAKDIISDIRYLISNGAKEITLLGQNVNSYDGDAAYINIGTKGNTWKLDRLLYEISGIDGLKRLRYTTSHPKDITVDLMTAHSEIPILVPFAHIPIQSGSDRILKLMNRGHTVAEYLDKLKMFRTICPHMQFSSDFIVGFPTETDEDFEDTVKVVNDVGYVVSYAFKYSRRKDTPASQMDGQISEHEKEGRLRMLQDSLSRHQIHRNNSLIGQVHSVLFDKCGKKENQYIGKNGYMQSVVVECDSNPIGEFRNVLIESSGINSVSGKILQK